MATLFRNPFFSGYEEDVDVLFMRYFRKENGDPTIFIQGNPVKAYFFNEYVALRNKNIFPEFPCIVVSPFAPKESTDMPVYTSPFVKSVIASDGTLTFYKYESLIWKDFTFQVDAYSKDYQVHRRLHSLLTNKLFPRIAGSRYFKVMDDEYRQLDIVDVNGWNPEPEGIFHSTITYTIKIPVWETEPLVQGSLVYVNVEVFIKDILLEVENLPFEESFKQVIYTKFQHLLDTKEQYTKEEFYRKFQDILNEIIRNYDISKNNLDK